MDSDDKKTLELIRQLDRENRELLARKAELEAQIHELSEKSRTNRINRADLTRKLFGDG